jgi:dihydrodipicolinate synthase/N-acetylneuraminate lyase
VVARTLAAALTPLRDDGRSLDEDAFGGYVEFLGRGGLDGVLALGSTGEGILFDARERKRAAELFLDGPLDVIVHCGAQTTATTTDLAAHAAEHGAAGVAVIAPPYFRLDERAILAHFEAAANACAPLPFYVYEFANVSGYAVPRAVIERLRERAPNLVGMKVSDAPWEAFQPYLIEGLDIYVGPESLIAQGLAHGAVGAVSALASALPEVVAAVDPRLGQIRDAVERFPRHAALKHVAARRGVAIREDVRAPLRGLTTDEESALDAWLEGLLAEEAGESAPLSTR